MADAFDAVDWGKELQTLVSLAKSPDERKAAFAFAQAINPYLDNPELLRTLLGKIMMSPNKAIAIVAEQKTFDSLEEVKKRVGSNVSVIPL